MCPFLPTVLCVWRRLSCLRHSLTWSNYTQILSLVATFLSTEAVFKIRIFSKTTFNIHFCILCDAFQLKKPSDDYNMCQAEVWSSQNYPFIHPLQLSKCLQMNTNGLLCMWMTHELIKHTMPANPVTANSFQHAASWQPPLCVTLKGWSSCVCLRVPVVSGWKQGFSNRLYTHSVLMCLQPSVELVRLHHEAIHYTAAWGKYYAVCATAHVRRLLGSCRTLNISPFSGKPFLSLSLHIFSLAHPICQQISPLKTNLIEENTLNVCFSNRSSNVNNIITLLHCLVWAIH